MARACLARPRSLAIHPLAERTEITMTPANAYGLADGVSFRNVADTVIFLDAAGDRYLRLTRDQSRWFSEVAGAHDLGDLSEKARSLGRRLEEIHLIRPSLRPGESIAECTLAPARGSAFEAMMLAPAPLKLTALPRFAAALAASHALEKKASLRRTLDAARMWKRRPPRAPVMAEAKVIRLCADFHALAPYFLTTRDACRFRSLLLVRYLAGYGVRSDWVFGVRLAPFRAHCWVEHDGLVLNDYFDHTIEFEKILSV